MRIEQVTKPADCPFREWSEYYPSDCHFEDCNGRDNCGDDNKFPPDCPLVEQDILVCAKTHDEMNEDER